MTLRASAAGDTVAFAGVATAYEAPYEMYDFWGPYTEVVSAGAGADSLNRSDLDVPLVLQHEPLRRLARTNTTDAPLFLTETDDGLQVDAPQLELADQDVAYIVPKLRSQLINEMSFKFMITAGQWSPDYSEFRINSYDIHRGDVAIVGYGANPATSAGLRATDDMRQVARDLPEDAARVLAGLLTQRFLSPASDSAAASSGASRVNQARLLLERTYQP